MDLGLMRNFTSLCKQISTEPQLTVKTEIMKGFLEQYTGDKALLYRLVLPVIAQRKYHIGDVKLVILLARITNRAEGEVKDLFSKQCGNDISEVVKKLHMAGKTRSTSTLTLADVDDFLERLSKLTTDDKQQAEIASFAKTASPEELKWTFRMIKNDLKLGAGKRSLLDALHPKAYETFKAASNLTVLIQTLFGGGPVPASHAEAPLKHHVPISPQLARAAQSLDDVVNRCPQGFYSEIKYDGERIQIHKQGGSFTFWSRSLKPMKADKYAGLEGDLETAFAGASSVIADGEILLIDKATSIPLPFGTMGKHKREGYKDACTCIFIFDILEYDGEVVMHEPISTRRNLMNAKVTPVVNRVVLSEMVHVAGKPSAMKCALAAHLKEALRRNLEGLVLKHVISPYAAGSRHWIKLKKDYLKGLADTADLVVIGRNYTFGGVSCTFLMGCYNSVDKMWKTVCRVGNGLSEAALKQFNASLDPMLVDVKGKQSPKWLNILNAKFPDQFVKDPMAAPVMEIIASEFIKDSVAHTSGISMRHARVVRVRDDKTPKEATTLPQLRALVVASKDVLVGGDDEDDDEDEGAEAGVVAAPQPGVGGDDEEEDEDDDYEDPMSPQRHSRSPSPALSAPSPPVRKTVAGATAAEQVVLHCEGEAVSQMDASDSNVRVVAHTLVHGGRWSNRGAMGQISRVLGDDPAETYAEQDAPLGTCQIVAVRDPYLTTGSLYVANLICMRAVPGKPPSLDSEAFKRAWVNLQNFTRPNGAGVHLYKPQDHSSFDWAEINRGIVASVRPEDVRVVVYCKSDKEAERYNQQTAVLWKPGGAAPEPKPKRKILPDAKAPPSAAKKPRLGDASKQADMMRIETEDMSFGPGLAVKKAPPKPSELPADLDDPDDELMHMDTVVPLQPLPHAGTPERAKPQAAVPQAPSPRTRDRLMKQDTFEMHSDGGVSEGPTSPPPPLQPQRAFDAAAAAAHIPAAPLHSVLQGKRVVVSGYPKDVRDAVAAQVKAMGGSVVQYAALKRPDIVVCETLTELYDRLRKEGLAGLVVRRQYIADCHTLRKRCEAAHYAFNPLAGAPAVSELPAPTPAPAPAAPRPAAPAPPPAAAPAVQAQAVCPPVFQDCSVFLHSEGADPVEEHVLQQLERHIIAHDGDVVDDLDSLPTHVVTVSTGPLFSALLASMPHLRHVSATPAWVWESIGAQCKLDISAFAPDV